MTPQFSLYIVFAYGFHFGQREPFTLLQEDRPNMIVVREGRITLRGVLVCWWSTLGSVKPSLSLSGQLSSMRRNSDS